MQRKDPDTVTTDKVFIGSKGIFMKFVPNTPPTRLYDSGSLDVIAEIENRGTYDLTGGNCVFHLSGYDESIIRGIDRQKPCSNNLFGKDVGFPQGGFDVVEFHTDLIDLPTGIDSFPQKMILSACYEYETIASPIVCIDPGLYKVRSIDQACIVKNVGMSGGQGAPVAVSNVEVNMVGSNKAQFIINIANVGGGKVLKSGTGLTGSYAHSCPFNLQYEDFNVVDYEVDMDAGFLIKCSPSQARFVNNNAKIFCTFQVSGDSARTTPLRIKLFYNYLDTIAKDINIIKTPE